MKPIKHGAYLGRCGICTGKIHNTNVWTNKTAVVMNAKYTCGACLVELLDAAKIAEKEHNKILESVKDGPLSVLPYLLDEETGRIKLRGKL